MNKKKIIIPRLCFKNAESKDKISLLMNKIALRPIFSEMETTYVVKNSRLASEETINKIPLYNVTAPYINYHANYFTSFFSNTPGKIIGGECPQNNNLNMFTDLIIKTDVSMIINLVSKNDMLNIFGKQPGFDYFKESYTGFQGYLMKTDKLIVWKTMVGKKSITCINYNAWNDRDVPVIDSDFFELINLAKKEYTRGGTLYVHCIAGLGRTPIFIASIIAENITTSDSFNNLMIKISDHRIGIKPTKEQLEFLFKYLKNNSARGHP